MSLFYKIMPPFAGLLKHFPKQVLTIHFRKFYHRKLQNPPESFYDKVYWMSLNQDNPLWARLADKYLVREYVTERCGEGLLAKLYGVYDSANEIDFDALPKSFVIKTNNGCASNCFVKDKDNTDLEMIRKQMAKYLKYPYGALSGERHYGKIRPKIIAEEYLVDHSHPNAALDDYKFYCFDGVPTYCFITKNRILNTHKIQLMMYDMDWTPLRSSFIDSSRLAEIPRPSAFEEMKSIAAKLSEGIKFVRVDLYEVDGKVKFSEMTFTPGMDAGFNEEFLLEMGKIIDLK